MRNLKHILFVAALISWQISTAQGHLFSEVKLNKRSVYVGEPVEVNISVFTSTWFTKGVNPGNVKVNGAFTVYFRGVSVSERINGKTYASVRMIFNVFPYEDGELIFPSLEVSVETPDEGGYKGIARTITTSQRTIVVKSIPNAYSHDEWLVARGVKVYDKWSGNINDVKVGDVLERNIRRQVEGTVSGLIPPITWDSIGSVSIYPSNPTVKDQKTRTAISSSRTDGIKYLFEKEGEVIIPLIEIQWWNAAHKKLYKRTIKEITINVQANPNLLMTESLRDSLALLNAQAQNTGNEQKGLLQRLTKKQVFFILVLAALALYFLINIKKWIRVFSYPVNYFKRKRYQYLLSEKYYFNKFKKAARTKDPASTINSLYQWIDHLDSEEPSIQAFAHKYGDEIVLSEANLLMKSLKAKNNNIRLSMAKWSEARKKYLKSKLNTTTESIHLWINP